MAVDNSKLNEINSETKPSNFSPGVKVLPVPILILPGTPLLFEAVCEAPFLHEVFAVAAGSITVKTSTLVVDHAGDN